MIYLDPETHVYTVDGRKVPSVTQVLSQCGLSPNYGGVDPNVLLHARERGIHVEECCRLFSDGTLDEESVHVEARPYLDAYKRWCIEHHVNGTQWQVVGFDSDCNVAGTTDILCEVDGHDAIVDVKAVWKLDRSYRIQLTAYRRMRPAPKGWRRYVLQLQKRGTYVLLDCDAEERREGADDEAAWLACVQLTQWKAAGNGAA